MLLLTGTGGLPASAVGLAAAAAAVVALVYTALLANGRAVTRAFALNIGAIGLLVAAVVASGSRIVVDQQGRTDWRSRVWVRERRQRRVVTPPWPHSRPHSRPGRPGRVRPPCSTVRRVTRSGPRATGEPLAWFADPASAAGEGLLATGLVETSDRLSALDDGSFWALVVDFEGQVTCARFADVVHAPLPPPRVGWAALRGEWSTSLTEGEYIAACEEVRRRIADGDVYQVNVCRVLEHPLAERADVLALAARTTRATRLPTPSALRIPGLEVVCASPELLLDRAGRVVTTGPIKGTARTASELLDKDVDENVMIVDLARNDLSTVCVPRHGAACPTCCAVRAPRAGAPGVARSAASCGDGLGWPDVSRRASRPASVTGAPKSSALRRSPTWSRSPRGPYCGAVGWVDADRRRRAGRRHPHLLDGRTGPAAGSCASAPAPASPGAPTRWASGARRELKAARLVGLAAARRRP